MSQSDSASPVVKEMIAVVDSARNADSVDASRLILVPYKKEFVAIASKYALPPALLAAVTQTESRFEPWATRFEPAYPNNPRVRRAAKQWKKTHKDLPNLATEIDDRSRSYGLMQVMGETAREQGFAAPNLAELYIPKNAIEHGALLLRKLLDRYHGDTLSAISAYNQGNNRKRNGRFANFEYVYRVHCAEIAWHKYLKDDHANNIRRQRATPKVLDAARMPATWTVSRQRDLEGLQQTATDRHDTNHHNDSNRARTTGFAARRGGDTSNAFAHRGTGEPPNDEGTAVAAAGFIAAFSLVVCGYLLVEWRQRRRSAGLDQRLPRLSFGPIPHRS
jgi:hypothetical protein